MKKSKIIKILSVVAKYVIPVIIGWLEGDSHTLQTFVSVLFDLY